ncbi:hypothetical protein E8E12_000261 [Didymella heteroderae]|uniref:Uncharacterized protein n=1 Tax=Didymella heteroderae TaxID=1769908 RepID=A0A9P5BUA0_9PLEO|nr:hypothetical protein E8E12_000261 [Didymella heteroderae]
MIIVTSIWQYFTLNNNALRIFRGMQLASQTYFTVFAFAPIIFVLISLVLPRHEIDKFGAGRLRVNIIILLIAAAIVSAGQIFRCVIAWQPPFPLRNAQGQFQDPLWYYKKACFYAFNFVPEIIVLVMYAVVRVDLRFHVPDGAKRAGDYSRSSVNVHVSEKALHPNVISMHSNGSNETLHSYQTSLFEESGTLADSLRYPSSLLEIDGKTGAWKVKRTSGSSSATGSNRSSTSMWLERDTMEENDIPPVPEIPDRMSWQLRDSALHPNNSLARLEHKNPSSRTSRRISKRNSRSPVKQQYELEGHDFNDHDIGDAVQAALAKLEGKNRSSGKLPRTISPLPGYDDIEATNAAGHSSADMKYIQFSQPSSLDDQNNHSKNKNSRKTEKSEKRKERSTIPIIITKDGCEVLRKQRKFSASEKAPLAPTSLIAPQVYVPTHMMSGGMDGPLSIIEPTDALTSHPPLSLEKKRSSSLEIIKLTKRVSEKCMYGNSNPRILDLSTVPKHESTCGSESTSLSNSFLGERPGLHEQILKNVVQPETEITTALTPLVWPSSTLRHASHSASLPDTICTSRET